MKPGINVQSYVDVKLLAGIVHLMRERNITTSSYSEVIKQCVETVSALALRKFTSVDVAVSYLRQEGFSMAQLTDKTRKNLLKTLQAEGELHLDLGGEQTLKEIDTKKLGELQDLIAKGLKKDDNNEADETL